ARLAAMPEEIAVNPSFVPRIQRVECGRVARGVRKHQVFVARRGGGGHGPPSMRGGPCGGKLVPALARAPYCALGSGTKRPRSGNGSGRSCATGGPATGTPCASRFSYES